MRGLLKNNFYSALESLKLFSGFLLLFAAALVLTGNAALLFGFAAAAAPGFALLSLAGLRKEAGSKWGRHKLAFPVRRSEIVDSFYATHAAFCLLGVLVTALATALTVFLHGNHYFDLGLRDALTLITGGGVIAVFAGAVFCPLFYRFGAEKTEALIVISFAGAVGFGMLLAWVINLMNGFQRIDDLRYYMSLLLVWAVTAAMFFLSSRLANAVFKRAEY
ncbi:ABC-2 transporter permease [Anaerofilum sp. BX8]|uniref:ABC-2 transporter permease n=1 Tax=Anaerofilum hominis TaxID=2763016 RepID=A0A923IFI5_9FIRM|nr:ABC-2 transporter permease [Anaerofilum hominis]MBC5581957.1 ABC-2 transporter permease [Anaerofilum hominis]